MKAKLTATRVDSLEPHSRPYSVRDTEVTGFLLRVTPNGGKTYYLDYRSPRGGRKSYRIGTAGNVKAAQARQTAKELAGQVAGGQDVQLERQRARRQQEREEAATLRSFMDGKYGPWAARERKSGQDNIRRVRANFPDLLDRRMAEITPWHVEKWRTARRKAARKPTTINRDLMALRSVLSKAVQWDVLDIHPLARVKLSKVDATGRVRYLSGTEEAALRKAMAARDQRSIDARARANAWRRRRGYAEYPELSNATYSDHLTPMVLLTLNTGLRRGEVLSLRWGDIDLSARQLTVVGSSAKSGQTRHVPLNDEAVAVLKAWSGQQDCVGELVFPGPSGRPLTTIRRPWISVLEKAGIDNFRWHDLRHHFASTLVMRGVDLYTVGTLLGHSSVQVTERYSHLAPEHLEQAVARLSNSA